MPRLVKLFIVRHGEREDEVIAREYWKRTELLWTKEQAALPIYHPARKMNVDEAIQKKYFVPPQKTKRMDKLDPLLTSEGHKQAQEAFDALLGVLPHGSRVAVFSSPLRRAIGTALMAGSVKHNPSIVFPPLESCNTGTQREGTIPIIVLNRLGDFAARVFNAGGNDVLVPSGKIRCGAMCCNDGSKDSPFQKALFAMPSHIAPSQKGSLDIRFWKQTDEGYAPMSDAIRASEKVYNPDVDTFRYPKPKSGNKKLKTKRPFPQPLSAIDDAVAKTVQRGCDVCIVVAHREAIHDMAEYCNYMFSVKTPYCCVGTFGAYISDRGHISYNFCNVWSSEARQRVPIPKVIPPTTGATRFMYISSNKKGGSICVAHTTFGRSWMPPQVWLSLAPAQNSVSAYFLKNEAYNPEHIIELFVIDDRDNWGKYVQWLRNKNCILHGKSFWESEDGSSLLMSIKIKPSRQRSTSSMVLSCTFRRYD